MAWPDGRTRVVDVDTEPRHDRTGDDWAAIVLAAGEGKRLASTGEGRAKVLREVAGRPMLSWVLAAAREAGAARIAVVVGHDRDAVVSYVRELESGRRNEGPGEARPVEFAVQERQLGTGDAVRAAEALLGDWPGDLWVLCGDVPGTTAGTLRRMAARHSETGAACTLLTMELDDPARYGRVMREGDPPRGGGGGVGGDGGRTGRVTGIVEFADATDEQRACLREVNSGTYAFRAKELFAALPRLTSDNAQGESYLTDVVRLMIEDGLVVATVKCDETRECMGGDTPEALARLDELLSDGAAGAASG